MTGWIEMKEAVRRAGERELDLEIGDKPINDPQIMGSPYDVRVEGKYLGWASKARCDELRQIYADTSSRLRRSPKPNDISIQDIVTQVGFATRKCREVEADMVIAVTLHQVGTVAAAGVQDMRRQLEILHEHVLMLEQERRTHV